MNEAQAGYLRDLHALMLDFPKERKFDLSVYHTGGCEVDCNTTCCAAGWGVVLLPSWKAHLKLSHKGVSPVGKFGTRYTYDMPHNTVSYSTMEHLTEFLGIDTEQGEYIFYGEGYADNEGVAIDEDGGVDWTSVTPSRVAKHVETVLYDYGYSL